MYCIDYGEKNTLGNEIILASEIDIEISLVDLDDGTFDVYANHGGTYACIRADQQIDYCRSLVFWLNGQLWRQEQPDGHTPIFIAEFDELWNDRQMTQ